MRRQQRVANGRAQLRHERVGRQAGDLEADRRASEYPFVCRPADGRPISTSPGRIAVPSISFAPIDDADDEAGDVVFTVGVEAGHLGRFAADQRAAVLAAAARDAGDDLLGDRRRQPARREVVEKEQRHARPARGCR